MSTISPRKANDEPRWLRLLLTGIGLGFLVLFLVVPLVAVFVEALKDHETLYAIGLPCAWRLPCCRSISPLVWPPPGQ